MQASIPTEHAEQATFVAWFRKEYPEIRIFAVPNGGYRHKKTAQTLSVEGVSKGVPDLYIPAWHLWIEMKRTKGGRLSPEQKEWIEYLESIGDTVIIGKGWEDARKKVQEHARRNSGLT